VKPARHVLIATDGVFSMDGVIANLKGVCDLADKYDALVMVDDSHAVGFVGENGRGSHEYCDVMGRVDIITGTLGKALGGASGGYTAARKEVVEWLRQRSVRICSPTRWRRRLLPPPSKCWRWWSPALSCATACGPTRVCSVKK
jgi:7-keto-8-aminopelargonate synthetase-like enzyme